MKFDKIKMIMLGLIIALVSGLTYYFLESRKQSKEREELIKINEKESLSKEIEFRKLREESSKYIDTVSFFEERFNKSERKLKELLSKNIPKIQGVKHYESTDIDRFYKEVYKLPKQVTRNEKGVCLSDTVAKKNIRDVLEGKFSTTQVKLLETQKSELLSSLKYQKESNKKLDSSLIKLESSLNKCREVNKIYSEKREKRWGIGPTLNYGLSIQKEPVSQTSVGIGISYSLFRF